MTTVPVRNWWALAVHGVLTVPFELATSIVPGVTLTGWRPGLSFIAGVALFLLAGCSSDIVLRHPATGRTTVCPGDYAPGGITTAARVRAVEEQSGCVWYYQQRGYEPTQGG
jgi:hypothetical protein